MARQTAQLPRLRTAWLAALMIACFMPPAMAAQPAMTNQPTAALSSSSETTLPVVNTDTQRQAETAPTSHTAPPVHTFRNLAGNAGDGLITAHPKLAQYRSQHRKHHEEPLAQPTIKLSKAGHTQPSPVQPSTAQAARVQPSASHGGTSTTPQTTTASATPAPQLRPPISKGSEWWPWATVGTLLLGSVSGWLFGRKSISTKASTTTDGPLAAIKHDPVPAHTNAPADAIVPVEASLSGITPLGTPLASAFSHAVGSPDDSEDVTNQRTRAPLRYYRSETRSSTIDFVFKPTRFSITLTDTQLRYRLRLTNRSSEAIGPIILFGEMITAHGNEAHRFKISETHRIEKLCPGETVEKRGVLRVPLDQAMPEVLGQVRLLVPRVFWRLEAMLADNSPLNISRHTLVGETASDGGVSPFDLASGPKDWSNITCQRLRQGNRVSLITDR